MYISKGSGMDHTVLPANTPCLPILRMRSPDGATFNWRKRHPIAAYYSSIDPEGMKGWVGLVGWPIADMVTRQLQVERRTEKVRRPKTNVLPLSHATNQSAPSSSKADTLSCKRWQLLWTITETINTLFPVVNCLKCVVTEQTSSCFLFLLLRHLTFHKVV